MPKNVSKLPGQKEIYRRSNGVLYLRLYTASKGEHWRSLGDVKETKKTRELVTLYKQEFYSPQSEQEKYLYRTVAQDCFEVRMQGNRGSTRQEARRIYDQLIEAFGHLDIEDVTDTRWMRQVERWKLETNRTRYRHVQVYARQIDRYAFKKGLKRFEADFPVADPNPKEGKVLSQADIEAILEVARASHKIKNRHMVPLFILFGRFMGMRKSEILGLEWNRVDLEARNVKLGADNVKTGSRTGRGRDMRIPPQVYDPLFEWYRKQPLILEKNAPLFVFESSTRPLPIQDMKIALWAVAEKSKVEFTPHDLRHTFYTVKLLVEKKSLIEVSEYGGTAVGTLQNRYLHSMADHTAGVVE